MKYPVLRGQGSNISWVFLGDNTSTVGAGKTGLTNASAGLNIAVRRELVAAMTAYSGANIGTIATLGTWVNPGLGKCNFKEVDPVNSPGMYEVHWENAVYSASDASRKLLGYVQATGVVPAPFEDLLTGFDVQSAAPTVTITLSQLLDTTTLPLTNASNNTVGNALWGALSGQGVGGVSIVGTTLTLTDIKEATAIRTFTISPAPVAASKT